MPLHSLFFLTLVTAKRKERKQQEIIVMAIWDFISWSTDSVKGLWQSSYNHGSAAITKVNKVVTVDAVEKVNQHLSDPETRSKISRVATDVAKNATIEGLKTIPGKEYFLCLYMLHHSLFGCLILMFAANGLLITLILTSFHLLC